MSFTFTYSDPSGNTNLTSVAYTGGSTICTLDSSVVTIGASAFSTASVKPAMTEVVFPVSLTSIGISAFSDCTVLTSTNLSVCTGLKSIGTLAFQGTALTSVDLSAATSLTTIGDNTQSGGPFNSCTSLNSVSMSPNITNFGSNFGLLTSLTTFIIPDASLNIIFASAFSGCSNLTSIAIPSLVTSIGNTAFSGCSKLTSIAIPSLVQNIGDNAFQTCSKLTSITIPSLVTSIGNNAFQSDVSLNTVDLSTATGLLTIGNSAFSGCSALTAFDLSSVTNLKSTGTSAFASCSKLTSITIPASVTSIGTNAFNGCSALTFVVNNANVTIIRDTTFQSCSSLTSINIPNSVTSIGGSAFFGCSKLTSIAIPSLVTSIGISAFQSDASLNTVYFSSVTGPTSFGTNLFNGCSSLTSINIPNSVTSFGTSAFQSCSSLPSITIPEAAISIGTSTFQSCSSLTSITIPGLVTSLNAYAFYNCTLLTSVKINNQAGITTLTNTSVFNAYNVAPTNKTVTFYLTNGYNTAPNPLSANGKLIAAYFSSDPSNNPSGSIIYDINANCFNENTKILCLNKDGDEEYIPIQNLRKGDLVKSYLHGYRKIDLIGKGKMFNDPSKFTSCMYLFEKTDHNDLIEDLIVTGGHSILVDQLTDQEQLNQSTLWDRNYKIDDKVLLLAAFSSLFKPITKQQIFTWYHFTLEGEDDDQRFGVFANGVLVEIPSKNQFKDFNIQEI